MTSIAQGTTQLFSTYKQIGKAEDVSDLISNITPFDTPFSTLIKSEKMTGRTHEWQEDELADASSNAMFEGIDASFLALTPTKLRENNTQILTKACVISNTSDAIKTHGRAKETALQLAKKMKEIKRDLEFAFVHETGTGRAPTDKNSDNNNDIASDDSYSNNSQRKMKSALGMVHQNHISSIGTVVTSTTATVSEYEDEDKVQTDATKKSPVTAAQLEQGLLTLHETLYSAGSEADIMMIPTRFATIVADFMDDSSRHRDFGKSREVVNVVDVYQSPFGAVKFVINRHMNEDMLLFVDPSMWRQMVLRPFTRTLLAPTGDHTKHFLVGEYSLKNMNYKSSGALWNTTYTGASSAGSTVANNTPTGGGT